MPILRISDISLLKRIALKNYLGVDIRTLEYCLLRSLREQEIPISFFQGHIPEADVIIGVGKRSDLGEASERSLCVSKNKITGWHGTIHCNIDDRLSRYEV